MYLTDAINSIYWRDSEKSWNRKVQLGVPPPEVSYFYIQSVVRVAGDYEFALEIGIESWTCLVIGWNKNIIEKWIKSKGQHYRTELEFIK